MKKRVSLTSSMFIKSIQSVFKSPTSNLYLPGHSISDLPNWKKPRSFQSKLFHDVNYKTFSIFEWLYPAWIVSLISEEQTLKHFEYFLLFWRIVTENRTWYRVVFNTVMKSFSFSLYKSLLKCRLLLIIRKITCSFSSTVSRFYVPA